MIVKILGSGCSACKKLEENAKEAFDQIGEDVQIEKVTDFKEIAKYNVLITPGLVVDEKVISSGKVLKPKQIIKLMQKS